MPLSRQVTRVGATKSTGQRQYLGRQPASTATYGLAQNLPFALCLC